MPTVQNRVPTNFSQNATVGTVDSPGGQFGEDLVAELGGKYYTLARDGRVFVGSTAVAGVTVPVATTTSPTFGIWNPAGSGVNAVLIKASMGYISGTTIADALCYASSVGVGSVLGTPVSAFVSTTPLNGLVGAGRTSQVKFSAAGTNTLSAAAAGVIYRWSGISHGAPIATTAAFVPVLTEEFDGTFIIPPGVFVFPAAALTSEAGTYGISWIWAEVPV